MDGWKIFDSHPELVSPLVLLSGVLFVHLKKYIIIIIIIIIITIITIISTWYMVVS